MIRNAVLWVARPELMLQRAGGLSAFERQLFTARRAGIDRMWVAAQKPEPARLAAMRLPEGLELNWTSREGDLPLECEPPYLGLSGEHLIRVETLRHIVADPPSVHTAYVDADGASVIQALPYRFDRAVSYQKASLPDGSAVRLQAPLPGRSNSGSVLLWLLASGPKSQDGFMAKHFDRHISLALSRSLLETKVTPNMMTVASSLIGLAGSLFFLRPFGAWPFAGAVLVWLHSVLDGCDGELARIRFQESPFGAAIDFWGDNLVHLALFACLAVGFSRADASVLPLALGAAAAAGVLGSATLAFLRKRAARPQPGTLLEARLARLETRLSQRDFIYLLLVLAYFGRAYEFLWAGAVGALLFFVMMLYLGGSRHGQSQQPSPAA